jgi:hypothetical protein
MKKTVTVILILFTFTAYSQDKDYFDLMEIFRKSKKNNIELTIYTKPPKSLDYGGITNMNATFISTEGNVSKVMREGVVLNKTFRGKVNKGKEIQNKKEMYYIRFDQILKIKINAGPEELNL